ncbi:MAG: hypothetical protein ACI959_001703 [Limisphaerales bacterium]|jgi:hypothetical protein
MSNLILDISKFKRDRAFYPALNLLVTIKSFDLQAIRKRYLASRKKGDGKAGSVARRAPSIGGIARLKIDQGELSEEEVLVKMKEPRGIDINPKCVAVAAEDCVYILHKDGRVKTISEPWFSYIHTVQLSMHDPDRILISSSGFDIFFEYDVKTGEKYFEWLSWEHGFNKANDPETGNTFTLTRDKEVKGDNVVLISDPPKAPIPTAKRAAFINSVSYHSAKPDVFLATFFHEGAVYSIDRKGRATLVLENLKNPHGGRDYKSGYMATSTASGQIIMKEAEQSTELDFSNLKGKPDSLKDMEWIQNAIYTEGLIIAIDSNRTALIIINQEMKLYDTIPYDPEWAIQDLVIADNKDFDAAIKSLAVDS